MVSAIAYFVDSSALAKRYIKETGSSWILSWIEPDAGNIVIISELALVEIRSLLMRRVREGAYTLTDANALYADFRIHYREDYLVIPVDNERLESAETLLTKHKLRTLDAIQLACALHASNILGESLRFVSGDFNLNTAAVSEGFEIENPNQHP
jgi:predicted nucleic acid-binding protein